MLDRQVLQHLNNLDKKHTDSSKSLQGGVMWCQESLFKLIYTLQKNKIITTEMVKEAVEEMQAAAKTQAPAEPVAPAPQSPS